MNKNFARVSSKCLLSNRAKNFEVWCINLEQFHGILNKTLVTTAKVITQNKHNTEYRIKEKDAGNTE